MENKLMYDKLKILHIEDEATDSELVERELNKSNLLFEMIVVDNREDYIKAINEFMPDIILSDHTLPSMDSFEALKILNETDKNIPFILISGTVSDEFAVNIMKAGAYDYILKDRMERLPGSISNAIEKRNRDNQYIESQIRFEEIINTTINAIISIDEEQNIILFNNGAERIFRYKRDEILGKPLEILLPSESSIIHHDKVDFFGKSITEESRRMSMTREINGRHSDGTVFPVEVNISKSTVNGKTTFTAILQDITERKLVEETLRKNEELLRNILNNAPMTIFALDRNGIFTLSEGKQLELVGLKPGEHVGDSAFDLYGPLHFIEFNGNVITGKDVIRNAMNGNTVAAFSELKGVIFENRIAPIIDNEDNVIGLIGVATDITKRKLAEDMLHESEERYRVMIETAHDLIWTLDIQGNFTFINKRAQEITGHDIQHFIGKSFIPLVHSDDLTNVQNKFINCLQGEPNSYDVRIYDITGKIITLSVNTVPIYHNGIVTGMFSFGRDISERKQAEEELIEQKEKIEVQNIEFATLNEDLIETNRELLEAKEKAEESDKLKTAFLANISHEIRTPMIGIIGFSKILSESNLSKSEKKEYAEAINKSSNRLLNLLNNIILASQLETGQIEIERIKFSLNDLINQLYSNNLDIAAKNMIEFNASINLNDLESEITNDDEKLEKILEIMLDNSFKFTNTGSINFGYKAMQNELEFYVKDTGCGISEEFLPHIFELFSQENTALNRSYEGAGVGLTIACGLVKLLGGRIWLESKKGVGTAFYFTIPK
jgi:PAS domain S-box-containing protein